MKLRFFALLCLTVLFFSCKKEEGYGGLAAITGKVYAKDYSSGGNLASEGYIGDIRVYISKQGETIPFDDVRTSYDGSFKFMNLHPGTYSVWVFGDCDYCGWSQTYEIRDVNVSKRKEVVVIEDFQITI